MTLEKNPLLFPIVRGGTVEIIENGYLAVYSGGSGSFSNKNFIDYGCLGPNCELPKFNPLKKGEVYKVTGVIATFGDNEDFRPHIDLITSAGRFTERDYQSLRGSSDAVHIKVNKPVHSLLFDKLSYLMFWPISMLGH